MRSMAYFPVMGVIIGLWGAVWYSAAAALFETYTAAIVSTMATVWLTGASLGLSIQPRTQSNGGILASINQPSEAHA
jgi:hypothetical protein